MCIRGARSQLHSPVFEAPLDVQIAEAHLYAKVGPCPVRPSILLFSNLVGNHR